MKTSKILENISKVLNDYASFEATNVAKPQNQRFLKPCEACEKPSINGGLCPSCISMAAGACQWRSKSV